MVAGNGSIDFSVAAEAGIAFVVGIFTIFIIWILIAGIIKSFYAVPQQQIYIVERFGKYLRMMEPGIRFIIPFIDNVVHKQDMRIRQLDTTVESKTQDNVFVRVQVSVQYRVPNKDSVYASFYELSDPERQMSSYIFNTVRSEIPKQKLDNVFDNKDSISDSISGQLEETMGSYGFEIIASLVSDIDPDAQVKDSMNKINAAERERRAAEHEAEAQKVIVVKRAEAERDSKILQGEGVAGQRKKIAEGMRQSIDMVCDEERGIKACDVVDLIKFTNYVDMMSTMGGDSTKVIMMPQPAGMDMTSSLMSALEANGAVKPKEDSPKD